MSRRLCAACHRVPEQKDPRLRQEEGLSAVKRRLDLTLDDVCNADRVDRISWLLQLA